MRKDPLTRWLARCLTGLTGMLVALASCPSSLDPTIIGWT